MKQPAAILVLQYWYTILVIPVFYQYLPVSDTGITSIFQNLPVSAILVLPVFSRIFQYLQYWYYQYFPESSSICNTGITNTMSCDLQLELGSAHSCQIARY
jgi:hypothetical protein